MNAQAKIQAQVTEQSVSKLQEMAVLLFNDVRDGSEIVLSAVLSALENKMAEADFVAFCESI